MLMLILKVWATQFILYHYYKEIKSFRKGNDDRKANGDLVASKFSIILGYTICSVAHIAFIFVIWA